MALPSLRLVSPDSDAALPVDRAAGVDIDELFRKYATDIASLGLAMLGKKDEADDLVQEVFLRAFRGIKNLRDPERIKPWLITIAVREGRTRLRRRKLSRLWLGADDFDFEQIAAPGSSAEDKIQIARLFRVLEGLGVDLRLAWILRYLQSETAEGVAEQCGWSLSTTKRRIRAAHDKVLKGMGS
jgi:RNA polymerase sigma-70 factor (ECF subfamily)